MNTAIIVLSYLLVMLLAFVIWYVVNSIRYYAKQTAEINQLRYDRRQMARIIYWHRECKGSAVIHRCHPAPEDQYTREWHDELV